MLEGLVSRRHISSSKAFDLEKEPHGRATFCPQISLVNRGLEPVWGSVEPSGEAAGPFLLVSAALGSSVRKSFKGLC